MTCWKLSDLVCDHRTGKLRETLLWSNIGKAAMTWGFVYNVWTGDSSQWLWVAYGGIVVAHEAVARVLNQKQQVIDEKEKA